MIECRLISMKPALLDMEKIQLKDDAQAVNPAQVERLIRAAAIASDAQLLASPKLMIVSGQEGRVAVGSEHSYVGRFEQKKLADGRVDYQPVIEKLTEGFRLSVKATAEGKTHMKIELDARQSQLQKLEEQPAPDVPAEKKLTIQKPVVDEQSAKTTYAAGDEQTMLVLLKPAEKDKPLLILLVKASILPMRQELDESRRFE